MTTEANTPAESPVEGRAVAPADPSTLRLLYWSVRRELWENRSLYIAPLAAAALVLFGSTIREIIRPNRLRAVLERAPEDQVVALAAPYSMAATLILVTGLIVGVFYCVDALYSERRDRSILFWKSLPVSDLTTVLSKMCIPVLVLPMLCFTIALATQIAMLLLRTLIGLGHSPDVVVALWTRVPLAQMTLVMAYGLTVHALWHAPLYAWLLLVSAWARRTPLLWAVLPPLGLAAVEKIAFGTSHFGSQLRYRLMGAMVEAFALKAADEDILRFTQLSPLRFLGSPGLWLGLIAAAALLAAAARLRRYRDPI